MSERSDSGGYRFTDTSWTEARGPLVAQMAIATFGILALELALIRWTSSQIRIFAYFNNIVLIGAFLGLGIGVALGKRRPGLVHWTLPALLVASLPIAFAEEFGLLHLPFPDQTIALWGGEVFESSLWIFTRNLLTFGGIWCLIVSVFVFAGAAVGHLFTRLPTLVAYSSDLFGSLLGIVAFTLVTFLDATPPVWLLLGSAAFLWLSRRPFAVVAFVVVLGLGWFSIKGAIFSPYNRIDIIEDADSIRLEVNRDVHQVMYDLSDANLARESHSDAVRLMLTQQRDMYDLPFSINQVRNRALVVGAGTGNDVQGAVRNGYREVVSVDIDPRIMQLGRERHPEQPYSAPGVIAVVNDARAFLEQHRGEKFDVVCYGFLDSHAMFSSMSSLRLDNYVYTEQGIRSALNQLSDQGHLSLSISIYAGRWFHERIYWTVKKATGREPYVAFLGIHHAATYIVPRDGAKLNLAPASKYMRLLSDQEEEVTWTTSDDWPFLFVRPNHFPWGYLIVLLGVLAITLVAVRRTFGRGVLTSGFDPVLFFLGAAFLLIETRGVTSLSLLFGSTWIVNSAIFASIITMALIANLAVHKLGLVKTTPWFVVLFLSVVLLGLVDFSYFNQFSLLTRGVVGGLINALPIGFAGIIVSITLARSPNPSASLGSNLVGSVVGGCLEYFSMMAGLAAMAQLALVFYLCAFFFHRRRQ